LGVSPATVGKWRSRFVAPRLEGLKDEHRSGEVEDVIVRTSKRDAQRLHRLVDAVVGRGRGDLAGQRAAYLGCLRSPAQAGREFQALHGPALHRKVKDVVGLYLDPPVHAVVLAVDEKSQIQALNRFQPVLPMLPGAPERRFHHYTGHGTTSVFTALSTLDGTVITWLHKRHPGIEFKNFLERIDAEVPEELDVHLIADNHATHKASHQAVAGTSFEIPIALRPHRLELAQPRRAVVLRVDHQEDRARRPPLSP
jgi:DDE superfamily endonuclease